MAFRESIEAILKVKDANRFKASIDKAARAVRKLGRDEEEAAVQSEALLRMEKKIERQSAELTAALTLVAHSVDNLGDQMLQAAAKTEVANRAMKKSGTNAVFLGKSWAFWKDRLSLTRSEILTTAITMGAYLSPALISLGSSFVHAALGGGGVAAGGISTFLFAMANLALVIKPAITQLKAVDKAQQQYLTTVSQYGAASMQASRASAHLGAVIQQNGGKPVSDAAINLRNLRNEWQKMSGPARTVFFKGLSDGLRTLRKVMPTFAMTGHQMMVGLRTGLQSFWKELQDPEILGAFRKMSWTFDRSIGPSIKGVTHLMHIFARMITATSPYVVKLAKAFERTTKVWQDKATQDNVNKFFKNAVDHFKLWWRLAKDLGTTLGIVFGSTNTEGKKTMNVIIRGVEQFNNWLLAMKNTGAIDRFFKKWNNSVSTIWDVFKHPEKAFALIDKYLPIIMDHVSQAFVNHAPKMVEVFIKAWWNAGAWSKLLTLAIMFKKFGFMGKLGGAVAGPFLRGFITALAPKLAGALLAEGAIGSGLMTAGAAVGGTVGAAFSAAFSAAAVIAPVAIPIILTGVWAAIIWKLFHSGSGGPPKRTGPRGTDPTGGPPSRPLARSRAQWVQSPDGKWHHTNEAGTFGDWSNWRGLPSRVGHQQTGGTIPPGGSAIVGESGRELATAGPLGTQITPLAGNLSPKAIDIPNIADAMRVTVYSYLSVDKREIARAVSEQAAYDTARRGGRPASG